MYSLEEFHFCRLCLCGGENLMDIFEDNPKFDFVVDETIQDLLQLKVVKVAGCPWLICSTCLYKLTDFRLFKRRCVECKIAYENRFNPYNTFLDTSHEAALKVDENGILNSLVESDPVGISNGSMVVSDNLKDDLNSGIDVPDILPNWDPKGSKVESILQEGADLIFSANITGDDVDNIVGAQESIEKAVAENFSACEGITPNMSLRTKVDIFTAELWKQENSGNMVIPETDSSIVSAYTEPEIPPSARIVGVVEGSAVLTGEPNLPVQDFDEDVKNVKLIQDDAEEVEDEKPDVAVLKKIAEKRTAEVRAPIIKQEKDSDSVVTNFPVVTMERCDAALLNRVNIKREREPIDEEATGESTSVPDTTVRVSGNKIKRLPMREKDPDYDYEEDLMFSKMIRPGRRRKKPKHDALGKKDKLATKHPPKINRSRRRR